MSKQTQHSSGGIGIATLVFLVFLVLKLGGWGVVATWSWWWVTAPLWGPVAFVLVLLLLCGLVVGIVKAFD